MLSHRDTLITEAVKRLSPESATGPPETVALRILIILDSVARRLGGVYLTWLAQSKASQQGGARLVREVAHRAWGKDAPKITHQMVETALNSRDASREGRYYGQTHAHTKPSKFSPDRARRLIWGIPARRLSAKPGREVGACALSGPNNPDKPPERVGGALCQVSRALAPENLAAKSQGSRGGAGGPLPEAGATQGPGKGALYRSVYRDRLAGPLSNAHISPRRVSGTMGERDPMKKPHGYDKYYYRNHNKNNEIAP